MLTIFTSLFYLSSAALSQDRKDSLFVSQRDLVGVWPVNTHLVTSSLKAHFRFFKDGTFIYNTDEYNNLNLLRSLSGKYNIKKNQLSLSIESVKQLTNFIVTESGPAFQFGPFQLTGGKIMVTKQKDSSFAVHKVSIISKSKSPRRMIIKIDADKYFKISGDPNEIEGASFKSA